MADIAGLHLQQDRISDLVAEVDTEARSLRRTERELLRLAEAHTRGADDVPYISIGERGSGGSPAARPDQIESNARA